MSVIVLY